MSNNQKLEGEVMLQWMMSRFKQTREQALASMPPEVRKNFDDKGNEFINNHFEIVHIGD